MHKYLMNMRNEIRILIVVMMAFCFQSLSAQSYIYRLEALLQPGDLIFQDLDCGPECSAIEAVTEGYEGYDFSHVGLVKKGRDSIWVGEAIGSGVQWTPLETFVERCTYQNNTPQLLVMRLRSPMDTLIDDAISYVDERIGMAYDPVYTYGDSLYYCSELLYDAFGDQKEEIFSLTPMTFKEPGSDEYFKVWVGYFEKMEHSIPEGEPGINPGSMSRSSYLEPIFVAGLESE